MEIDFLTIKKFIEKNNGFGNKESLRIEFDNGLIISYIKNIENFEISIFIDVISDYYPCYVGYFKKDELTGCKTFYEFKDSFIEQLNSYFKHLLDGNIKKFNGQENYIDKEIENISKKLSLEIENKYYSLTTLYK